MRVGVIGAGVMGTNHARVLGGLPGVTMVGIVDPLAEHRTRATEHAGCRAFETLDQLIAEGVDAVTIAAPTHLHHEIALVCIARNIHIMVEKPVASTVEEGREILKNTPIGNVFPAPTMEGGAEQIVKLVAQAKA